MARDIAEWLDRLGLGRYADRFVTNEIDLDSLSHITEADLKDIGVALGPRRKLLAAIAELGDSKETAKAEGKTGEHVPGADAERRQLTVMFVDLVGSTSLSAGLDPEEMRAVIRGFQDAVAGEIARLDGHVAKFMGDGVLVYFGWPRAHENEAERAVRAGLAVMSAIERLQAPDGTPLVARIGIATGLVVVGDLIGEGSAREETVVGDTPNLAARLQALAEPGRVLVAEATKRLLGGLFELNDLGRHEVKGLAEQVAVYRVVGERTLESRFAARGSTGLSEIVGRDQELALLLERWRQASKGEGQMVLLTGEAGIGKSRITEALIEELRDVNHTPIRYQCSPYHTDSALYPAIQQLSLAAGFERGDDTATRLDKLEVLLGQGTSDVAEQAPLIAPLLELDGEARYGALGLSPQQLRARMLMVLVDQLKGLALAGPVLSVIEDAHWIDPTTLELIELALDTVAGSRVLLLVTARPTFEHGFGGHPVVTRLMLNRLGRSQIAAIATRVSGGKSLPDALLDEIAAKTDGVPLFVEEIAKAVLESDVLREEEDAYALTGPLSALTIPATLHDSLMARLDRLRPVKEVAQLAAVIGRAFDYRTLAAIAPQRDDELASALDGLVAAELVFRRGIPPDADYLFKHALVRDAAYESLLKSKRQALHAALFEALQCQDSAVPELLAHHATEAGLWETAAANWLQAGRSANSRSAFAEAIAHLEKGLQVLSKTPNSTQRARREIELRSALATAMISARGYGAPEAEENFDRALELSNDVGNLSQRFVALHGLWWFNLVARSIARSRKMGDELQAISKKADEIELQIAAHRALGYSCWLHADFKTGLEHCRQGLALYDHEAHGALASRFGGADPGVALNTLSANCHWYLGQPDQSLQFVERNTEMFSKLNHPLSECWGRLSLAQIHLLRGERDAAERGAVQVLQLAQELSFPTYVGWAMALYGWSLLGTGNEPDSVDKIREGIRISIGTGTKALVTIWRCLLAEAAMKTGDHVASRAALDGAEALVSETQERLWAAELHRLRGLLHLTQDGRDTPLAEACFQRAIETARRQDAKSWELRAATSLACLWAEEGERGKAVDLLAPILQWFTEGHDTRDLKNARAQLEAMT